MLTLGARARAQHDAPRSRLRLQRVACDVEQRLDHLVAIEHRVRQARIVVALDAHRRGGLGAQQLEDVLADLVHVHERCARRARTGPDIESTSAVSRSASPMMSRVYSLSVRRRQLALEQLRRAAQPAQGILDLVRELANHEAAAVEAREQVVLARDALPLRGVGELEQQLATGDRRSAG